MARAGVIYCASGKQYVEQAAASARSIRRTNSGLQIAIFCASDDIEFCRSSKDFDIVSILDFDDESRQYLHWLRETRKLPSLKVLIGDRSPFEKTLMLDSDTLVVGDLSQAFQALDDFDLLVCEECQMLLDPEATEYRTLGLADTRLRGYYNAGVIFFVASKEPVRRLMKEWRNLLRGNQDSILSREDRAYVMSTDQTALNHLIAHAGRYLSEVVFSGVALKPESYNCYCRMWTEVWQSGRWSEARILHTWMTTPLSEMMSRGDFTWERLFHDRAFARQFYDYLSKFAIARETIPPDLKKKIYTSMGDARISLREHLIFIAEKSLEASPTPLDDLSRKYDLGWSNVEGRHRYAAIFQQLRDRGQVPAAILKIGLNHNLPSLPGYMPGSRFRVGYDLEYLADAFPAASITGVSRYKFIKYVSSRIRTVYCPYPQSIGEFVELHKGEYQLIVDSDNALSLKKRLENAALSLPLLAPGGLWVGLSHRDNEVPAINAWCAERRLADCQVKYHGPTRARNDDSMVLMFRVH
jgi:lipopolysaccharide biosynthesis glycosyltransferase